MRFPALAIGGGLPHVRNTAAAPYNGLCRVAVATRKQRMIRRCTDADFQPIETIVNEAARSYRGAIPDDCWHEPYMSAAALKSEIEAGVDFWGWGESDNLLGIMG